MGIIYLSVELALDLLTVIIGGIIIFQSKDNYHIKRSIGDLYPLL